MFELLSIAIAVIIFVVCTHFQYKKSCTLLSCNDSSSSDSNNSDESERDESPKNSPPRELSFFDESETKLLFEKADQAETLEDVVEVFRQGLENKIVNECKGKTMSEISEILKTKFKIDLKVEDDSSLSSSSSEEESEYHQDLKNALEFCKNKSIEDVNKILKKFDIQISNAPARGISTTINNGIVCDIFLSGYFH